MPGDFKKNIHFFFDGIEPILRNKVKLRQFLTSIFVAEGIELGALNFIFSTDRALRTINKKFLQHDFFTDVVTFNLAERDNPVIGEVYISIDRVRDNALRQNEPFQKELHRVIFHGVLHLCGYQDKSRSQLKEMRKAEDIYLSRYFG